MIMLSERYDKQENKQDTILRRVAQYLELREVKKVCMDSDELRARFGLASCIFLFTI
jgi:hypothetical protein